jgi:hypothetical protein
MFTRKFGIGISRSDVLLFGEPTMIFVFEFPILSSLNNNILLISFI